MFEVDEFSAWQGMFEVNGACSFADESIFGAPAVDTTDVPDEEADGTTDLRAPNRPRGCSFKGERMPLAAGGKTPNQAGLNVGAATSSRKPPARLTLIDEFLSSVVEGLHAEVGCWIAPFAVSFSGIIGGSSPGADEAFFPCVEARSDAGFSAPAETGLSSSAIVEFVTQTSILSSSLK